MKEQVSVDENIMGGQPCVAGTRIPVYMILEAGSIEVALTYYPQLTVKQAKAAFDFAKDFMQNDYVRLKRLDENVKEKIKKLGIEPFSKATFTASMVIELLEGLDK